MIPPNRFLACLILFLIGFAGIANACQVPVFRYALERWWPDPYVMVVVHRGELSAEHKKLIEPYLDIPDGVNIDIQTIDLDHVDAKLLKKFAELPKAEKGPELALYYPSPLPGEPPVYTAVLNEKNFGQVLDSPARREIASHILKGDSAVWVVIDTGSEETEKQVKRLQTGLDGMAEFIELPEGVITLEEADELMEEARKGAPQPPGFDAENILNYGVPLRLGFSVVRVDASSEAEAAFIRMLVASSPDLDIHSSPVTVPVFGRGRMLEGIPINTLIDEDILPDACHYICGACSCQVKAQNPGLDLLMKVDWEGVLEGHSAIPEKKLPPLSGPGDLIKVPAEVIGETTNAIPVSTNPSNSANLDNPTDTEPLAASPSPPPVDNPSRVAPTKTIAATEPSPAVWIGLAGGVLLLGIALGSFVMIKRNRS